MALTPDHIARYNENLAFLQSITARQEHHWKVTVLYYGALHAIQGHLAVCSLHPTSHTKLRECIEACSRFEKAKVNRQCYESYLTLEAFSRRARYMISEGDPSNNINRMHPTTERHVIIAHQLFATVIENINNQCGFGLTIPSLETVNS